MTAQLIQEMLGPNWWSKVWDQNTLLALADRVAEGEELGSALEGALRIIVTATDSSKKDNKLNVWSPPWPLVEKVWRDSYLELCEKGLIQCQLLF